MQYNLREPTNDGLNWKNPTSSSTSSPTRCFLIQSYIHESFLFSYSSNFFLHICCIENELPHFLEIPVIMFFSSRIISIEFYRKRLVLVEQVCSDPSAPECLTLYCRCLLLKKLKLQKSSQRRRYLGTLLRRSRRSV